MKVYLVYAHPNPDSFNNAVRERLTAGLEEAGHSVTVSDLYADGFNCALGKDDLAMAAEGKVSDEVKAYQEKISAAEGMAFVFPIWWFGPPALLKGWFDRVLAKGFAYDFGPQGLIPMLKVKKALVISTAGGMEEMYKNIGFTDAINKILVNGTLQFCGIWNVKYKIFHNVVDCDDQTRKGFLEEARTLGKEFF
jgi:NAD(P)H dehydrogenase (quinone)